MTFECKDNHCPHCGNSVTVSKETCINLPPKAGDFVVCGNCTAYLRYDNDMHPRMLESKDTALITGPTKDRLEAMKALIKEAKNDGKVQVLAAGTVT